jgi:excisionase family DNA binding protein
MPTFAPARIFDEAFIDTLAKRIVVLLEPHLIAKIAPRYLNLDQAAEYLGSSRDGVRGMLRAKLFPVRKLGARVLIDKQDIDAAMTENMQWLED